MPFEVLVYMHPYTDQRASVHSYMNGRGMKLGMFDWSQNDTDLLRETGNVVLEDDNQVLISDLTYEDMRPIFAHKLCDVWDQPFNHLATTIDFLLDGNPKAQALLEIAEEYFCDDMQEVVIETYLFKGLQGLAGLALKRSEYGNLYLNELTHHALKALVKWDEKILDLLREIVWNRPEIMPEREHMWVSKEYIVLVLLFGNIEELALLIKKHSSPSVRKRATKTLVRQVKSKESEVYCSLLVQAVSEVTTEDGPDLRLQVASSLRRHEWGQEYYKKLYEHIRRDFGVEEKSDGIT